MPDDWIPQLLELLEGAYQEWYRLAACYTFFGLASVLILAAGLLAAFLTLIGR